jgi:hypothetical protein
VLAQSVVLQDSVDDAKPFSLDAVYTSGGIEKVKCPGRANQACQEPPGALSAGTPRRAKVAFITADRAAKRMSQ